MRILNKEERNLIEEIFGSTQEGIKSSMEKLLTTVYGYDKMIITPDYVVAQGDIPVGIVAHMDTVHRKPVVDLFYDQEENVMWSPQGLGADDRAGVYGMIEIMRRGLRPTMILTTDEETGGRGAAVVAADYDKITVPINFLIELDRRGYDDCVFYDCDNEDFEKYIEDYGFKTDWGSFSDISFICPAWGMAGVNLSIGYYNEHTLAEYLDITDMFNTLDRVCEILSNVKEDDRFTYIPKPSYTYGAGAGTAGYAYLSEAYGYYNSSSTSTTQIIKDDDEVCWGCIGTFGKDIMIQKDGGVYCGDCYAKMFTTCIDCGADFEDKLKVHLKCENCRNDI